MTVQMNLALLLSLAIRADARIGPIIHGPSNSNSGFSGSFVPAPHVAGEWIPNPYYAGPDIFTAHGNGLAFEVRFESNEASNASVQCVVDGRAVIPAAVTAGGAALCDVSFVSFGGLHSVAAYLHSVVAESSIVQRVGDVEFFQQLASTVDANAQLQLHESERLLQAATPVGTGRLGIYYTTYQQADSQLYQNVSREFGWTRSMDHIFRNASLELADSIWRYASAAASPAWRNYTPNVLTQVPALGVYCFYRKRGNESAGPIADCPEGSRVLQAHASEMVAAGFQFVAPDATNWDGDPRNASGGPLQGGSDLNQLRPTEIIAEEWANMRLRGEATPTLSIFDRVNVGGVLYQWYLSEFFNNETLLGLGLILREPNTTRVPGNRKVYVVADEAALDYDLVRQIQSNGGREDVVTPIMWAARDASGSYEANGYLKYYSPCTDTVTAPNGTQTRMFSTDIILDDVPCGHLKTHDSPLGDVWTISAALPCNSMPLSGSKMNGLFLKKQFWDVFADPTPTDFLFAPSWNEFDAGPNLLSRYGMDNPFLYSSGAASTDPNRSMVWWDGYSAEGSRTIEPSVEDGGYYYELFASCMRVYRLQAALRIVGDGTGCAVAGEECCMLHADEAFTRVWSLQLPSAAADAQAGAAGGLGQVAAADSLLTSDPAELATLLAAGWEQLCSPWASANNGQPTRVCVNASLSQSGADVNAARGPLLLRANSPASRDLPGAVPLVRCVTADGPTRRHFMDSSSACAGGAGTPEAVLGYGAAARDGLFLRDVHRCEVAGGPAPRWYTVANAPCAPGDADQGVLLYAL